MKKDRMVWALTKQNEDGTRAVGRRFTFPASKDTYLVKADGSVRSTKIKMNKAMRKRIKRQRQEDRRLAGDNKA